MRYVLIIELAAILLFVYLFRKSKEFSNPYKLYMIFGGKGSGKTTLMHKLSFKHRKKNWKVYSDRKIPGCYHFKIEDFGQFRFPEDSCILIDEVSLIWGNRDFKHFQKSVESYFRYQRQYKNKIYLFSQSFDIDKRSGSSPISCIWWYVTVIFFQLLEGFGSFPEFLLPRKIRPVNQNSLKIMNLTHLLSCSLVV